MKNRITLLIVGVVGLLWAFMPDPAPFVIDDIIAAIGGAAAILAFINKTINKND